MRTSASCLFQIDYNVDSEGEWEEPCKDGEELRSDAEDLSDSEAMDSDSDTDSFIVPHGHLSDDEMNEDEQQQVRRKRDRWFELHFLRASRRRRNKRAKQPSRTCGTRKSLDAINSGN